MPEKRETYQLAGQPLSGLAAKRRCSCAEPLPVAERLSAAVVVVAAAVKRKYQLHVTNPNETHSTFEMMRVKETC